MTRALMVFSPLGRPPRVEESTRTTVSDLSGGVLGVLDNTKPNARLLMEEVARDVSERVGGMRLVFERKSSAAEGMTEDVRERLSAAADLIFTGSGD